MLVPQGGRHKSPKRAVVGQFERPH